MENKVLKEKFIDERTGIEYRLVGDYYIPNITIPKARRTGNIGKYGRLKLNYMKKHTNIGFMWFPANGIFQPQKHKKIFWDL